MARRPRSPRKILFSSKLALHAYMLGLFGAETLQQLGNHIKDPSHEGRIVARWWEAGIGSVGDL